MRQLFIDIAYSIQCGSKNFIILVIQFIIFTIFIGNIILYEMNELQDNVIISKKGDTSYYKLYQNDASSSMTDLWNVPFLLEKMQSTLREVKLNNNDYMFTSFDQQQKIGMFVSDLNSRFATSNMEDYLAGSFYPGYYSNVRSNSKPLAYKYWNNEMVIDVSMCKVDEIAVKHYGLAVNEGRNFSVEDYTYDFNKNETVAILGNEYRDFFKVGDTFKIAGSSRIIKTTVIGFLPANTNVKNDRTFEHLGEPNTTLDYSVVLPCYEFEGNILTDEDKMFATVEYVSNLCGTLILKSDVTEHQIKEIITQLNYKYMKNGLFTVAHLNSTNGILYFQGESSDAVENIRVLLIFLAVFNILAVYITLKYKIKREQFTLAVQMANGRSLFHVMVSYISEVIIIALVSTLCAYMHDRSWFSQNYIFHIVLILFVFISCCIISLLIYLYLKQLSIHEVLWRGRE